MNKNIAVTVLFVLSLSLMPVCLFAQILPKEGSSLNYILVGFSFPSLEGAINYKIEIATGNITDESDFKRNITRSFESNTNYIIVEVPSFGKQYTWRVVYTGAAIKKINNQLHHFSTQTSPLVDTTVARLKILNNSGKYKDAYVFLDSNMALYNMKGYPVWFLPHIPGIDSSKIYVSCLKLTPQGTITFMIDEGIYEINYNGDVLWKGPDDGKISGGSKERYHHEFTRLGNGHYMVMGNEVANAYLKFRNPSLVDSGSLFFSTQELLPETTPATTITIPLGKTELATIIEYDQAGNVAWSYKTSTYFTGSDLINRSLPGSGHSVNLKVHANSFYFDEKDSALYINFKEINRIIKIKYPEGTTLNTYGEIYKPQTAGNIPKPGNEEMGNKNGNSEGNGLFCGLHYSRSSEKDYLYIYNYGASCLPGALPRISKMKQTEAYSGGLEKVWEYKCKLEDTDETAGILYFAPGGSTGGNVEELPDGSLFASMSSAYSKVFIVNMNKQILWSAMAEKWNPDEKKWKMLMQYRASIIPGRKEMEKLVWSVEK